MCLVSLLVLITGMAIAAAQDIEESVSTYKKSISGNTIGVSVIQGNYDFSGHTITKEFYDKAKGTLIGAKIDGREIAGTDGTSPFLKNDQNKIKKTIREIRVIWNNKPVKVPKSLHINLFSLDLQSIRFTPSPEGDKLLLQALGGDCGASYMVSIILKKNGQHQQFYHGYWEDPLPPNPKVGGIDWRTD